MKQSQLTAGQKNLKADAIQNINKAKENLLAENISTFDVIKCLERAVGSVRAIVTIEENKSVTHKS